MDEGTIKTPIPKCRVSDPHWFNADPDTDPAFFLIADPDTDPDPKPCLNVVFTGVYVWGGVAILLVLNLVRIRVLNSCRIWSTTQFNNPPQPHTVCVYCTFALERGGEGWGEVRERVEGQQFTREVENTIKTDCISSL
jgi:hypothetical protein